MLPPLFNLDFAIFNARRRSGNIINDDEKIITSNISLEFCKS